MFQIVNLHLHGHNYSCQVDDTGKIVKVACQGRWTMADARFVGDDWLIAALQSAVNAEWDDTSIPFHTNPDLSN